MNFKAHNVSINAESEASAVTKCVKMEGGIKEMLLV